MDYGIFSRNYTGIRCFQRPLDFQEGPNLLRDSDVASKLRKTHLILSVLVYWAAVKELNLSTILGKPYLLHIPITVT